jgi:acyl-CoA reductase-like NAD-dependent aldehyde dehydrogenase
VRLRHPVQDAWRVHRKFLDAGGGVLVPPAPGPLPIISPFNLPALMPMWFLSITVAAGNTVVLTPGEKVPSSALWLARPWADAGLPEGVVNVLHGDKGAVEHLPTHPDIATVTAASFTASRTRSRAA